MVTENTADRQILTKEVSKSIKGISAIEIMIGHLGNVTGFWFLYPNRKAGVLFVGLFFMISGYGLMYNLIHKNDYMEHFLTRRLLSVLIPAYIVYLLYGMVDFIRGGVYQMAAFAISYAANFIKERIGMYLR